MQRKGLLDLPDELLLKIIAWVPYRPGGHDQLQLVCHHFRSLVGEKALSGMIAWYQFAPFMRLLEGYRGRSTSEYSRAELVQTWKSVAMHREWIAFFKDTTGLNTEICLTSISIVHFIAASNRKLLDGRGPRAEGERDTLSYVFLVKAIQMLPPYVTVLLRYLIKTTLRDFHDRHMPYDRLYFLRRWATGELNEDQRKSKLFVLDCVNASTCALLDGYRPFYNILADVTFHWEFLGTDSVKTQEVISILSQSAGFHGRRDGKPLLGSFALHARLVELSKEGALLSPLNVKVDNEMDFWQRLSLEYTRMRAIDKQVDEKFANMKSTPDEVRNLHLEDIGRALKDITTRLQSMREEDILEHGEENHEIYKLDQWR